MKLDDILKVETDIIMNENKSFIVSVLSKLGKMPWNTAKKFLKDKAMEFASIIKNDPYSDEKKVLKIINTRLGTNFSSINSMFGKTLMENTKRVDEGLKDWWKEASGNMYGALSFYPLLMTFIELDKVIKDVPGLDVKAVIIYFIIWVLVITGKVLSGSLINKKDDKVKASAHPSQVGR